MIRTVRLENDKLKKLIEEKQARVTEGRKINQEIDLIKEAKANIEAKIVEEEQKVDVSDLTDKLLAYKEEVKQIISDCRVVEQAIYNRIKDNTPQDLRDQYEGLDKQEKDKEQELHKLGHRVQKIKDKIIPLVQKLGKEHLQDEFEDYETTELDADGTPVLKIFNHLEDFKKHYLSTKE